MSNLYVISKEIKTKSCIYVKKNMLFYLEFSSRDLSDEQSREKATKPLQYVSHARKLGGNVWEYPAYFGGVCPTFKMADFTAKRSIYRMLCFVKKILEIITPYTFISHTEM